MHPYSLYDKLSKVAMSFPGVYEKPCHDTPAFYTEKIICTAERRW